MEAAEDGRYELVVSSLTLRELEDVLMRPKFRRYFPEEAVPLYLGRLMDAGALREEGEVRPYSPDPKDDYLAALARSSGADYLVSGDPHLFRSPYLSPPFVVLTPRGFLEELERPGPG